VPETARAVVLAVLLLSTSVWLGGYVAIAVVARVATATLEPAGRVAFFRALGRRYLWVGGGALVVAIGTGAALLDYDSGGALLIATIVLTAVLVGTLAVAVGQARRQTRLRRAALAAPRDEALAARVHATAVRAGLLRALLGAITVALVVLGSFLAV
jgi:hypothetical protein